MPIPIKEVKKRKFEFKYYNPYHSRKDIVFACFLISIMVFSTIFGLYYFTKILLVINSIFGISILIVLLIDCLTSEKI